MKSKPQLRKLVAMAALGMGLAGLVPVATAAQATGTLVVSALVLSVCTVATTPVVFATYTLLQTDVQGSLVVTCTPDITSYKIGLGAGVGPSATVTTRKMTSLTTGTPLEYALFRDSGRTQNWGLTQSVDTLDVTGAALIATYPVYGRLPASQSSISPGVYADAVQVVVNY